jgi:hypothetical protein
MTSEVYEKHQFTCLFISVTCSFCVKVMQRKDLQEHQWKDCTNAVLTCPICHFQGKMADMKLHLQNEKYAQIHISKLIQQQEHEKQLQQQQQQSQLSLVVK